MPRYTLLVGVLSFIAATLALTILSAIASRGTSYITLPIKYSAHCCKLSARDREAVSPYLYLAARLFSTVSNKAVELGIQIAKDDTHGYSQINRYSPDYDCSSFIAHCLAEAGFKISKLSTTRNIREQLLKDNWVELPINSERKAGDIFLNEAYHVIMCIDSNRCVYASCDECGGIEGRQKGDQTGNEIKIANFYVPSYGWDYHLRANTIQETHQTIRDSSVYYGDISNGVAVLQSMLEYNGFSVGKCGIDKEFGKDTLKAVEDANAHYSLEFDGKSATKELFIKLFEE